ncbi:MAG: winged helix-turn-helix domain-containing protein [Candidatus Methanoperedens sp.]|nr:winged helix-turn-helix domain-containing protein [Candidatus Methanoperedens sp.]MCZ7361626.1 winged helix-turn-helix domain-containing protein [Candidatus Methanoperedens sp.]HLB70361.1 winged helix-turn-helix domain-containing protein [Candidatus Methanoperedens sp.]
MDRQKLARILDALGNENSLNIMSVLANGERYGSELAKEVGISRPLLYLHLKKLENAGLVESEIRHFEEPPYTKKFYKAKNFELLLSLNRIREIVNQEENNAANANDGLDREFRY